MEWSKEKIEMEWNDRIKISDEEAQEKAEKKDKVEEKE